MTISKNLLFVGLLITNITAINAVSLEGFDTTLLEPYTQRAQRVSQLMHDTLQFEDHGSREIIWTGKTFAKKLYIVQKKALKTIKRELKLNAKELKDGDQQSYLAACQLHKAFKHLVYKSWKKRVKARYQETKKSNDAHAWGWIHHYKIIED